MDQLVINVLNGLSAGLLLFLLSSGLTLIFSMMGVLNFAHASFYMLGAYIAHTLAGMVGFWAALVAAPLLVGAMGAAFERFALRRVHRFGHVPELLITFGLSYVILEIVQLGHVAEAVHAAQRETLERRAHRPHEQRRGHERRPEAHDAGERVGDVGAQHVEARVGEVEHTHHAEDQREAGAEQEQQQPGAEPVQDVDDKLVHGASLRSAPSSGTWWACSPPTARTP